MTDDRTTEPLEVRVARALGCNVLVWASPYSGKVLYHCDCEKPDHNRPDSTQVCLYGSDTPGGWAATGPLVGRYGLNVQGNCGAWTCWDSDEGHEVCDQPNACAAVAEWVAQYGGAR